MYEVVRPGARSSVDAIWSFLVHDQLLFPRIFLISPQDEATKIEFALFDFVVMAKSYLLFQCGLANRADPEQISSTRSSSSLRAL